MIASLLNIAKQFVVSAIGWLTLGPVTFVMPRDRHLYVFVGRDGGMFLDNCKHFFLRQRSELGSTTAVFLTKDADLYADIQRQGGNAARLASFRGLWMLMHAGTIVVDSVDWSRSWHFAASRGARIVQLWHGIPLKEIELALYRKQLQSLSAWKRPLLRTFKKVVGRFVRYDVLLCTSQLTAEQAFAHCFHAAKISAAGYPRNDALLADEAELSPMTWINVDPVALDAVSKHRKRGDGPVLLYAPTFRRELADPFESGGVDLDAISAAAEALGMLILVKLHPWMHAHVRPRTVPSVQFVAPDSDIYPLLRNVDALITDYSSIYFDFLLLDRPIVFFCYDLDTYTRDDRALLFDYQSMTPGPKARTMSELTATLRDIAAGSDGWSSDRARVRSLVFDHADCLASQRLMDELQ